MKASVNHSLGIAVFVAALLLWQPGPGSEQAKPVDESRRGMYFALTKSSGRIVAAGEHGRILYSLDNGKTWLSSQTSVDVALTGIFFLNDRLGWAVGHEGVILKTTDNGTSWTVVRKSSLQDPALFCIWFKDEQTGLAVGADSTVYRTLDGGTQWTLEKVPLQTHLYFIVQTDDGGLWIGGDNSALFKSADGGQQWEHIKPPFAGSFFGAFALPRQQLLTFGLRGRISLWEADKLVDSRKEADENLSAGLRLEDGRVLFAGQRGQVVIGQGETTRSIRIPPAKDISAVIEATDAVIFAGEFGLMRVLKSDLGL